MQAVWQANMHDVTEKVWHQMNREGAKVARCKVERRMKRMGWHGVHHRGQVQLLRTSIKAHVGRKLIRQLQNILDAANPDRA
jgi:transposase InsO family protein